MQPARSHLCVQCHRLRWDTEHGARFKLPRRCSWRFGTAYRFQNVGKQLPAYGA